ncbi:UDP-N-acetylmuramoyl-tripeptide--D-alanyl-D-alanine ligase [Marinobacterium nitratireducens]|uniref:UDP-N-acetylmuramoyl-tripeptide--D-alanyl-D-alanine ligase n=2 Tax=Marinobacterium nitratireducens TaxID=518897 RepID=A0A917ZG88_9GAMM|nr:UDP-N-acetylmuramoyl-tripeptide--D-alanyl-D-alanine ligase [Marinobacterium nitratireducens]
MFSLAKLVPVLEARLEGTDLDVEGVSTDTRQIGPGDLFVALRGERFDAHDFVAEAQRQGAVAAVVDHALPLELPQLVVADTRIALGRLAQHHRGRFTGTLVAVTGSSGKTSVKEMLASIFAGAGSTLATRGNFNNDIGVPLTLFRLEPQHRYAVIEMGASGPGEIDYVTRLASPDVAILNNAMGAHLEGFGSLEGVVRAKGEIFNGLGPDGTAVVNADDPHAQVWLAQLVGRRVLRFGLERDDVEVTARHLHRQDNGCYGFDLAIVDDSVPVRLQVLGRHNVANALAAAAAAFAAGMTPLQIADGLGRFEAVPGRMRPLAGPAGCRLIDDSYNANPGSVRAAIDMLADMPGARALVLGDMAELGADSAEQHAGIGRHAAERGIEHLFGLGRLSAEAVKAFNAAGGRDAMAFHDREQLINHLKGLLHDDLTLLVKGSRSAAMEKVIAGLTTGEI